MTVIAEFSIPSAEFLLGEVLQQHSGTHVEVERVVPVDARVMPYVWVSGVEFDRFEREVRASEHVVSLGALDRVGDSVLYKVAWSEEAESLLQGFAESNATIVEAHGNDVWEFRVRFEDRDDLGAFHEYCLDHDIAYTVERIYSLDADGAGLDRFSLTDEQGEALVAAVEGGYFEVPRRTSLGTLAAEFGISQQAASERVRRATDKVLTTVLRDRAPSGR